MVFLLGNYARKAFNKTLISGYGKIILFLYFFINSLFFYFLQILGRVFVFVKIFFWGAFFFALTLVCKYKKINEDRKLRVNTDPLRGLFFFIL